MNMKRNKDPLKKTTTMSTETANKKNTKTKGETTESTPTTERATPTIIGETTEKQPPVGVKDTIAANQGTTAATTNVNHTDATAAEPNQHPHGGTTPPEVRTDVLYI